MNSNGKIAGIVTLALAGAVIAGCGGGSGGGENVSDGGSGNLPPLAGIAQLSGLDGDANNQDILYFSGGYEEEGVTVSSLYAISPENPDSIVRQQLNVVEEVNNSTPEELARRLYRPLYEADIAADKSVTNYRVSDVVFLHNRESGNATSEGFARASTDGPLTDQMGERVSSETYSGAPYLDNLNVLWENYVDAGQAELIYGSLGNNKFVRMTYPETKFSQTTIANAIKYVSAYSNVASDLDSHKYLVLIDDDAVQCGGYLVSTASISGSGPNGVVLGNLLPAGKEANQAFALGGPLNDGTQYLVISVLNQADCESEVSLWRYDPSERPQNALTQVLNEASEPLIFPAGGPMMPAERHLARDGDVLYFGVTAALALGTQDLYRVEGNSWSVLSPQEGNLGFFTGFVIAGDGRVAASVGTSVVSWDTNGNDRKVLDGGTGTVFGILTDVLGSRDGWIFYNRADSSGQDNAVAMKIDGSDSLEIPDALWFGASSTGNGDSTSNMTELSEVFFWRGRDIGAVSAAAPNAGVVSLGKLGSTPGNVVMYGLAPGPHRLIQVLPPVEGDGRVYYVNTRNANSLQAMTVGNPIGHQAPVKGF